jgi:dihydropteroate synthase
MPAWIARGRVVADGERPRVMGIVNATPDSFSDGGLAFRPADALTRAEALVDDGADILDIGGESTRPGAEAVATDEEIRRVVPLIETLAARVVVPISVDTTKPEVARLALAAGASIVNDITALSDPAMLALAAEYEAGVVLMHMQGTPQTMQLDPHYDDVVTEVLAYLADRIAVAERAGIPRERIAIDPGIGFGKRKSHNLALLRHLDRFATLGCAVLVGVSRKGFLTKLTGRDAMTRPTATVACSLAAIQRGARIVRVHDVAEMVEAVKVWGAIEGSRS